MFSPSHLLQLDLNLLVLFDAILAEGQLTAAAKRVGLSQPAASQALGRLRAVLDDPLFVRARSGMEPTPRARRLAPAVREALVLLERTLRESSAFDPATSTRRFRVGFGAVGELSLLPPLLSAVAEAAPSVGLLSVRGSPAELGRAARAGELDLFFDYQPPTSERLASHRLRDEAMVVIARRDHPRVGDRLSLDEFFAESHVVLSVASDLRERIETLLQHAGRRRRIAAEVLHHPAVPHLVTVSDALAIVPRSVAELPLHADHIRQVVPPFPLAPIPLYAIWPQLLDTDPGHRWLRERVVALG